MRFVGCVNFVRVATGVSSLSRSNVLVADVLCIPIVDLINALFIAHNSSIG